MSEALPDTHNNAPHRGRQKHLPREINDNRDLPGDLPGQITGGGGGTVTVTYPVRPSAVQEAEVAHYFQRQSLALTSGLHLNTHIHTCITSTL